MKIICIYHAGCLDGFASAFILWKTLGPRVEFIPAVYGKEPCYADLADNEAAYKTAGHAIKVETFACPHCGGILELGMDKCEYCGQVILS